MKVQDNFYLAELAREDNGVLRDFIAAGSAAIVGLTMLLSTHDESDLEPMDKERIQLAVTNYSRLVDWLTCAEREVIGKEGVA